jgi:predicted nucleic acid-binding protein
MFFDTYALIEIAKGNPRYKKYLDTERIIVTGLNLIELYYAILRDFDEIEAKRHYFFYLPFAEEVTDEIVFEAMQFRLGHRELSYADCIGYTMAKRAGVKFLTGDIVFKGVENVEFVR